MATKKTSKTKVDRAKTSPKAQKAARRARAPQSQSPPKKLSALDAAARVLAETKQALSCPELIEAMAAKGYWTSPAGQTPAATLSAAIQREIKLKGEKTRFKKSAPGRFSLA